MGTNRRKFLSLLGIGAASAPLAAKAASDAIIAQGMGVTTTGLGGTGLGLPGAFGGASEGGFGGVPYEQRLIGAADYIKIFGIPAVVDEGLKDQARWVGTLDPDIACKKSWSMSVKILTQRQRNYDRLVERMKVSGWHERGKQTLKSVLGYEWPW